MLAGTCLTLLGVALNFMTDHENFATGIMVSGGMVAGAGLGMYILSMNTEYVNTTRIMSIESTKSSGSDNNIETLLVDHDAVS